MRMPTTQECTDHAAVDAGDGRVGFAVWYPQMGGYVARAVVVPDPPPAPCFTAYVWHDGTFPFDDGDPAELHHCEASQFVDFGKTVERLIGGSS
jgi:hypothetical protein